MTTIAVIMFLALAAIAMLHAAWGFGVRWPAEDERDLVALVVGRTGRTRMPAPSACWRAAAAIFVAGLVALAVADLVAVPALFPRALRNAGSKLVRPALSSVCAGLCLAGDATRIDLDMSNGPLRVGI